MHVVAIIFGLLLLAFGGGCSLLVLGYGLNASPSSMFYDRSLMFTVLLLLGVLPALLGGLLLRRGISAGRRKNQSADRQDPG
jgi:hypothetical protein